MLLLKNPIKYGCNLLKTPDIPGFLIFFNKWSKGRCVVAYECNFVLDQMKQLTIYLLVSRPTPPKDTILLQTSFAIQM